MTTRLPLAALFAAILCGTASAQMARTEPQDGPARSL